MIIKDRQEIDNSKLLICTSIGGSPIHEGHCRLILDCKPKVIEHLRNINDNITQINDLSLLIIVNSDLFLIKKHGFCFQSENSRAEILDSFKNVDYTYIHQSDKQTIDDAIYYFQPHYLLKGGDRSSDASMPPCELKAVDETGCKILYSVGGSEKASSSSDLMKRCANFYYKNRPAKEWIEGRSKPHTGYCLEAEIQNRFDDESPDKERQYLIEWLDKVLYPD